MGVACGNGIERLRRHSIEQRVDGIGVGSLEAVVGLETKPGRIFFIDVVVEADGLHLFVVVAGVRNALPVGATLRDWTTEDRGGRAGGVSIESEHLLIKQTSLIR